MAIKKEQAKKKLFSEEERTEWKKDITSDSMDIGSLQRLQTKVVFLYFKKLKSHLI